MKYRTAELMSATDLGASGTKSLDINVLDPISRISFYFKTTKSKNSMDSYLWKDIPKIELVDGSDVLHSLNGGENQALCIFDRKVPTMNHGQESLGNSTLATFAIDFGRFLWDPILAFDPTKFKNPQLKITYDEDVADTGVTVNECKVLVDCFDEKIITPIGFLSAKELYSYTCGNENSYEDVDLPTDYPIRKILLQAYYAGYEPWVQIAEARLSEDNLKRIIFDHTSLEYYHRMRKGIDPPVEELLQYAGSTGVQYYYVTPTDYWIAALINNMTETTHIKANPLRGGKIGLTAEAASQTGVGIVRGYLPNHCFQFPFGDQNDPDDWYDVTQKGSVKLRLRAGSSGTSGTGAVVVQQLRNY